MQEEQKSVDNYHKLTNYTFCEVKPTARSRCKSVEMETLKVGFDSQI